MGETLETTEGEVDKIDRYIERLTRKLMASPEPEERRRLRERIEDLQHERVAVSEPAGFRSIDTLMD